MKTQEIARSFAKKLHSILLEKQIEFKKVNGNNADYLFLDNCEPVIENAVIRLLESEEKGKK